ncbi:MAG: MBL fold metallo-hydrolase [Anaerovoracaceae bacterium]|jgi:hydroxyacylglutathione hydrolase
MIIKNFTSGPLGTNSYLVTDKNTKKSFIVDAGGHNVDMVNHIKENQLQVEYIILTHGHGDHIGGVEAYKKEFPGVKLVAGAEEKQLLSDAKLNFSRETTGFSIGLVADHYVIDGETIKVGDMELKFIHTPGHTKGGICILVKDALFSGDTLFAQSIGRTDFPGGSYPEIVASIRNKLFVLPDDTRVYPGHMNETTIGREKETNPFV